MRIAAIALVLGFGLGLGACTSQGLETSQMWIERMDALIRPGMTRAEVEAAMGASRYVILDGPRERVAPPRALTAHARDDWHLLVELEDRVGCTEQRHMHLRFGPDGRLAERISRGFLGCT